MYGSDGITSDEKIPTLRFLRNLQLFPFLSRLCYNMLKQFVTQTF